MNNFIRTLAILSLILVLLASFPSAGQQAGAQQPPPRSKISSRLDIQVKEKLNYLGRGGRLPPDQVVSPRLKTIPMEEVAFQKVFLHFKEPPAEAQINELQSLGVKVYPGSWIPPVGSHPTGYVYAEMPVSRLADLEARDYLVSLRSAEVKTKRLNNVASQATGVNSARDLGYYGAGVTVAVLDSGIDVTHADLPTGFIRKDYSGYPVLDDSVGNAVTGHGTHVTGSVLGRGTLSGGLYQGVAPQASLVFLKIGNDVDAGSTTAADVAAIKAAVDVYGARVINMSYGGWTDHHDGADEESQAADYAVSRGAVFFAAAGNEASNAEHYLGTVGAGDSTAFIPVNAFVSGPNSTALAFNLVWFDGIGISRDLTLEFYDSLQSGPLAAASSIRSESYRGTENRYYRLPGYLPASGGYYLKVKNNSGAAQDFHIYYDYSYNTGGSVTFTYPDPSHTLGSPAEADGAIAVGAWVTRTAWTDFMGVNHNSSSQLIGTVATWSSRGPRVDPGAPVKPNIVAPGSWTVSMRDKDAPDTRPNTGSNNSYIVDNDGTSNGLGPADYIVNQGTSMASPHAAGVAALLLSKNPAMTPARVRAAIESSAVDKGDPGPDNISGHGLINAPAALALVPIPGDANRDGAVNSLDLSLMFSLLNKRTGDAGFNPDADFNGDGIIDLFDLVRVGLNFGRVN